MEKAESFNFVDGPLPLSLLREEGKSELFEILQSIRGRKCLVLQQQLGGLFNQIIPEGSKLLKEKGVHYFRELRSELGEFSSESGRDFPDNIIYFVRPVLSIMKTIASHIQSCIQAGNRCQFYIYFVPNRTVACEQLLEDEGVLEHIEIGEFHLGFVPLDSDLMTLEMEGVFRQCYLEGDTSSLSAVSRALSQVQSLFGMIPSVRSKGAGSRKVLQRLLHMRREEGQERDRELGQRSQIDMMIMLDRECDLISPLVTPLTYEGLLDQVLGIDLGKVRVDASLLGDDKDESAALAGGMGAAAAALGLAAPSVTPNQPPPPPEKTHRPGEKASLTLNSGDPVYSEIRGLSIERLGGHLQEKAVAIRARYSAFRENKDASISEIHDFVKKIPALTREFRALQRHINLAELLKQTTDQRAFRQLWQGERGVLEGEAYLDQLEEMISADPERENLWTVLRLLCLQSLTAGGVRASRLEAIKRMVSQCYGFEHLFTLANLEKTGLLRRKEGVAVGVLGGLEAPSPFSLLKRSLRLMDERGDGMGYVTAGYAPISARLVEVLGEGREGEEGVREALRLIPGPLLSFSQTSQAEELSEALHRSSLEASLSSLSLPSLSQTQDGGGKKVLLLVVVGGLSYSEVAALRHLSRSPSFPYSIVMAASKLLSGAQLLKTLSHDFKG